MIKRIETWLINILQTHLQRIELAVKLHVTQELAKLREEMEEGRGWAAHSLKTQTQEIQSHAQSLAEKLLDDVAADAKAIALFRQTVRMPCAQCGQMSWTYAIDRAIGKVTCADCQKNGSV